MTRIVFSQFVSFNAGGSDMNFVCKKEDKVINFTLVGAPSAKQCLIMVVLRADFSPLLAEQEEP